LIISGLPEIVAAVTATATFEGENYVLWQQVGRYLFKCVDKIKSGQDTDPRMAYLRDGFEEHMTLKNFILGEGPCPARGLELLDPQAQVSIYRHRAVRLVLTAYTAVHTSSKSAANAWNEQMLCIIAAARAHVEYLVVLAFVNGLAQLPESTSPSLRAVLSRLCSLFALSNIISPTSVYAISFVEDGFLTATHLQTIRGLVNDLLEKLLPDIIALTDAWDFTDASLCSALGMYDGNVYENIMRWVNQLPINQRAWKENRGVYEPGWTKWISPVLKANL
jgi:acyl-CoA oxidase